MRLAVAVSLTLALLAAGPSRAQSLGSEWAAALHARSDRLLLYTILKERPAGALPVARRLLHRTGLAHTGSGVRRLSFGARVAPILEWDDNINGGTPGSAFQLGPFEFTVDEESRAKSGLVVGASFGASADFALGHQNLLKLGASAAYRYAPAHEMAKSHIAGSACGSFYQGSWTWIETCAFASVQETELSRVHDRTLSLAGVKVFSSPIGSHEARAAVLYSFRDDYEKPTLDLDLVTAHPGLGAISLGLDLSRRIAGENTTIWGASLALARPILGESGSVAVSYHRQGGALFFGDPREDDVYRLSVTRKVSDRLSASLGVTDRRSTIDLYDQTSVFFGLSFDGWRF